MRTKASDAWFDFKEQNLLEFQASQLLPSQASSLRVVFPGSLRDVYDDERPRQPILGNVSHVPLALLTTDIDSHVCRYCKQIRPPAFPFQPLIGPTVPGLQPLKVSTFQYNFSKFPLFQSSNPSRSKCFRIPVQRSHCSSPTPSKVPPFQSFNLLKAPLF